MGVITASVPKEGRPGSCDFTTRTGCRACGADGFPLISSTVDRNMMLARHLPQLFSVNDSASNQARFGGFGEESSPYGRGPLPPATSKRTSLFSRTQPMFDRTLSPRLAKPRVLGGGVRTSGGGSGAKTGHVKGCPDFTFPATVGLRWMRPNHGEQARRWGFFTRK